ncbi:SAFB-like transcription modulator [Culex pipiens pallens]|uniref:SAFB-like transcription modulator n=1 Tax=Culex pipiens pallens TaxID=42434 RepID=UPI001954CE10|nr:SAFB-like transcription modulator [Culex pipiens pallens]
MSDAVEKRKLSELRVVDLKQELEKRGKDGNGVKNVLIERLTQALKEENKDPETFEFEIGSVGKTPAKKKAAAAAGKAEEESGLATSVSNGSVTSEPSLSDMQVRDECTDESQKEGEGEAATTTTSGTANGQTETLIQNISLVIKQEKLDDDEIAQQKAAEAKESQAPAAESVTAPAEATDGGDKTAAAAGEKEAENEDSLNLEIGEEDEKLLHDATGEKASEKTSDAKSTDDGKSAEKGDSTSEKPATLKEEKDAGKSSSSSSSASKQSGDATSKSKSSPGGEKSTVSRNLWVSGLSTLTRATDLKLIFSKYGKVIGAKVVTNTRTPGTRCYGYVTMASAKDATECITHLHRTELHGRMISVERAKSDLGPAKAAGGSGTGGSSSNSTSNSNSKPSESSSSKVASSSSSTSVQPSDRKDSKDRSHDRRDSDRRHERGRSQHRSDRSKSVARGRSQARESSPNRSRSNHRAKSIAPRDDRSRSTDKKKDDSKVRDKDADAKDSKTASTSSTSIGKDQPQKNKDRRDREREVLSLQKIREERDRQRLREKERQLREEDRRRREIRQRQREEEQMLRREREKLAIERARIEKEKAELLRIERERQKLEREKIELERLELKRQQRKIEEAKRNLKRPGDHSSHYDDDRKRSAGTERRFEAPPPPSISSSTRGAYSAVDKPYSSSKRDDYASKRDDYKSSSRDDYKSRTSAVDDYRSSGVGGRGDSFKRNGGVMDDYNKRTLTTIADRYSDSRSAGGASGGLGSGDYRGGDRDRNGGGGLAKSRYLDSSYPERSSAGGTIGSGGVWHSSTGPSLNLGSSLSGGGDTWRMDNGQDRYDRTYNERKAPQMSAAPFLDPVRPSGFLGGSGGRPQDRYGAPVGSGRFDNGRY